MALQGLHTTYSETATTSPIIAESVRYQVVSMTSGNGSVQPQVSYDNGTNWLNVGPAITSAMSAPSVIDSGGPQMVRFVVTYSSQSITLAAWSGHIKDGGKNV